jgi:hypothetical protein
VSALLGPLVQTSVTGVCQTESSILEAQVIVAVKGKVVEGGLIIVPAAFRKSMGSAKDKNVFMELHRDELRVRSAQ